MRGKRRYSIAIIGKMPLEGYSGGRYHMWIMAEALAYMDNIVYFVTNCVPTFSEDFVCYPKHSNIMMILVADFNDLSLMKDDLDYVICATDSDNVSYKYSALLLSLEKNARFAFINFETPNWYKKYAVMTRRENAYLAMREICEFGCLIISSTNEAQKYAKDYYDKHLDSTEFVVWSPAINSMIADSVHAERKNQVMIFIRIADKHKGGDDFIDILGEELRGMKVICVSGVGNILDEYFERVNEKARQYSIIVEFVTALCDEEKFRQLKQSKVLIFPSYFEGYGYPPVEALYCGTKCVAYDLPVLREVSGDSLCYCPIGDVETLKKEVGELLKSNDFEQVLVDTSLFDIQALRLQTILEENFNNPKLLRTKMKRQKDLLRCRIKKRKIERKERKKKEKNLFERYVDNRVVISSKLCIDHEDWKVIKKTLSGKKIFIWGRGALYEMLYPTYIKHLDVYGLIDKNPVLQNTRDSISGRYMIYNPEELKRHNPNDVVVFISNKNYVDEIIIELEQLGIKNVHSLCLIEMNRILKKRDKGRRYENER